MVKGSTMFKRAARHCKLKARRGKQTYQKCVGAAMKKQAKGKKL